jgi:hypothetical protein
VGDPVVARHPHEGGDCDEARRVASVTREPREKLPA